MFVTKWDRPLLSPVVVRPACAIAWRWKSAVGLAVGTTSWRQGCPPRGGIWKKPEAKSRTGV